MQPSYIITVLFSQPFFLFSLSLHIQVSAEIFEAHAALGPSASELILPSSRKRNKSGDNVKKAAPALSAAEVKEAEFISKKQRRKLARCKSSLRIELSLLLTPFLVAI